MDGISNSIPWIPITKLHDLVECLQLISEESNDGIGY